MENTERRWWILSVLVLVSISGVLIFYNNYSIETAECVVLTDGGEYVVASEDIVVQSETLVDNIGGMLGISSGSRRGSSGGSSSQSSGSTTDAPATSSLSVATTSTGENCYDTSCVSLANFDSCATEIKQENGLTCLVATGKKMKQKFTARCKAVNNCKNPAAFDDVFKESCEMRSPAVTGGSLENAMRLLTKMCSGGSGAPGNTYDGCQCVLVVENVTQVATCELDLPDIPAPMPA